MKKLFALMLAVLMVAGLFAGCNGTDSGDGTGGGDRAELYPTDANGNFIYGDTFKGQTIEWWFASTYELNSDMYIFKKIEEVVGCEINVTVYQGETYSTKINNAIVTNDLPDMFTVGSTGHARFNDMGDQGAFVNLLAEENLAKIPEFKKKILDNPDLASQMELYKSPKGNLYTILKFDFNRVVNHGWMYREDIFEKEGIEMWTDDESFLDALRALKTAYPDSYPLTGADMYTTLNRVISSYGHNSIFEAYDWDKNEWYFGGGTEEFYNMLCLYQTAYKEKLIDPDIFSNQTADIDTAVLNNESFVYNSWIGRMSVENDQGQKANPDFQVSYAPHIGNGQGNELQRIKFGGQLISANSEHVDACLAILNFLYSDEGISATTAGEEGKTYDTVDGVRVYKNADGTPMETVSINTLEEQYGLWNEGLYVSAAKDSPYFTFTAEESEAQIIGSEKGLLRGVPVLTIPDEENDKYVDTWTTFKPILQEFCAKFITEGYTREDWQNALADWEAKGYLEVIDILNRGK